MIGCKDPNLLDQTKCEFCGVHIDNEFKNGEKTLYLAKDDEGNWYCYCGNCLEIIKN
jgi:hypothetical protein